MTEAHYVYCAECDEQHFIPGTEPELEEVGMTARVHADVVGAGRFLRDLPGPVAVPDRRGGAAVSDLLVPIARAAQVAADVRAALPALGGSALADRLSRFADLLDPPPAPSLRDEVASAIAFRTNDLYDDAASAVLAVVRRHVEGLPATAAAVTTVGPVGPLRLYRDDVLRLLGGAE